MVWICVVLILILEMERIKPVTRYGFCQTLINGLDRWTEKSKDRGWYRQI